MFNVRKHVKTYLDTISPWVSNQWYRSQFLSEQAIKERTDSKHVVFPIPTRPYPSFFEALLLGPEITHRLITIIAQVERFNYMLSVVNNTPRRDKKLYMHWMTELHMVIGHWSSEGLFENTRALYGLLFTYKRKAK